MRHIRAVLPIGVEGADDVHVTHVTFQHSLSTLRTDVNRVLPRVEGPDGLCSEVSGLRVYGWAHASARLPILSSAGSNNSKI